MAGEVAINCDMGEAFGLWELGDDEALMPLISMANVACGFHAGDPMVMQKTVRAAVEHGVRVGAHPSYPDLQGFGRRAMAMDPEELTAAILYQAGALKAFLDAEGAPLTHLKPHGALYGQAAKDEDVANAVADAAEVLGLPVLGMAGTKHEEIYAGRGLDFRAEYYADLEYDDDGGLLITRKHEGYDPEKVKARVTRVLRDGVAESVNGNDIAMRADCVCVHSDTPGAPEIARAARDAVREAAPSPTR